MLEFENKLRLTKIFSCIFFFSYAGIIALHKNQGNIFIEIGCLVLALALPVAILYTWTRDVIDRFLNHKEMYPVVATLIGTYGVVAHTFAGDLTNGVFGVDPTYFTITNTILTAIFPFVIMGKLGVPVLAYFIFTSGLILTVAVFYYLLSPSDDDRKKVLSFVRFFLWLAVIVSLVSTYVTTLSALNSNIYTFAERVALATDFNSNFRCSVDMRGAVDKVVFLQDGMILAHLRGSNTYAAMSCI